MSDLESGLGNVVCKTKAQEGDAKVVVRSLSYKQQLQRPQASHTRCLQ
jgi:hypothetical protein